MRFQHVLHALHCEPLLLLPSYHATLVRILETRLAETFLESGIVGITVADAGDDAPHAAGGISLFTPQPKMTIADGIAEIPISGPIGKGLGNLEKSCGACSIEDVQRNIAEAMDRKDVRGIMLSIGSPGGSITGIPETASMIARARETKPVLAFTDGMMASAAYWIGSQADAIVATKSAQIGSIGVYIPWADQSRRYEAAGVKTGVVKNKEGTFKGMGYPGTALTEAQMAHLQERADELFGMFKSDILAQRPSVKSEAMQGQTLFGAKAKDAGLADDVSGYAEARSQLQTLMKMKRGT